MTDVAKLVEAQLYDATGLADDAKLLILAALEGDEALADMAGFTPHPPDPAAEADVEPVGAFLNEISVRGFRGIGPEASLKLDPKPGLTIVAGRNGSGKSSFAEALELALTGTSYRWSNKRSKQWEGAWRNLHSHEAPRVQVALAEEGIGQTQVSVEWGQDGELEDMIASVQRHGQRRQAGLSSLGWASALETYRPLLTYEELGALLAAEPSKLYDALSRVLGLEQLADALARLDERRRDLAGPGKTLARCKRELLSSLGQLGDDERAQRAHGLVQARGPDVSAMRSLAAGVDADSGEVSARLRSVMSLSVPDDDATQLAVRNLREAVGNLASAGDAATASLERRNAVLTAALTAHEHDGDMPCPVCGEGTLDATRAVSLRLEVDQTGLALGSMRQARESAALARKAVLGLISALPVVLVEPLTDALEATRARTETAWTAWAAFPDGDEALVEHILQHRGDVESALWELQQAVAPELAARDEGWSRVASQLSSYAEQVEDCSRLQQDVDAAKAAVTWLKDHDRELKNQRLQPIAAKAMGIWAELRQESNVEISGLTLESSSTRRRVAITSSVDGQEASGLNVLSQGELHALALALFLPRATMSASPFRFVVLDDPVQAMDPTKVDGLLNALTGIAQERQVVVFSHDDRLAAAARRAGVDARITEISREAGSVVSVRPVLDPASRYLQDARAMARDEELPSDTKRRLLPGVLRMATEASARDRYFGVALAQGMPLREVEEIWSAAHRTGSRVALAIFGDARRDLTGWLAKRPHRRTALGICSTGFHDGLRGDALNACRDVEALVDDVHAGAK